MTQRESNEVMHYVGKIEGLAATMRVQETACMDEDDEYTLWLKQTLMDIAMDLSLIANGADADISSLMVPVENIPIERIDAPDEKKRRKGGDEHDV